MSTVAVCPGATAVSPADAMAPAREASSQRLPAEGLMRPAGAAVMATEPSSGQLTLPVLRTVTCTMRPPATGTTTLPAARPGGLPEADVVTIAPASVGAATVTVQVTVSPKG